VRVAVKVPHGVVMKGLNAVFMPTHHPVHTLTFCFQKIILPSMLLIIIVFRSCFQTHACYITFLLIFLWFCILLAFDEVFRLLRFLLWNFLQSSITFHLDLKRLFHCFTVHFDSLSFIHTHSCTFSYNYVSVF